MDFFKYASFSSYFTSELWVNLLVGGFCFAIVFVFQAVALFVISGREGYKYRFMSFIPILSTYYVGVCAQKNRAFRNVDTKIFALIAAVLEAVLFAGFIVYYIAAEIGAPYEYVSNSYEMYGVTYNEYMVDISAMPANLAWAGWCSNYLYSYILRWLELVFLFLQVMVFAAFYQTYAARRYFIFTITSVFFPIQGILFFILRNNKGMNYRDYMRKEQERQYNMYRQYQQQNFNQNPYSQNPYDRSTQNGQTGRDMYGNAPNASPEDPFSEFGASSKKSDPFDFDDTKN